MSIQTKNRILHSSQGFTLMEILCIIAIVGLLVAIAVPGYLHTRRSTRAKICISNLQKIDTAKETWAFDEFKTTGIVPSMSELLPYLHNNGRSFQCALGPPGEDVSDSYEPNPIGAAPTCKHAPDDHKL